MAALTVTQSGNLSSSATFGGTAFADGDTITLGAFTLTVDVNATIGTSPNDTTTKSLDMTNAASVLVVAAGITLTMKGNVGQVNDATWTQQAGSTVTFDNSASGGTPVYTFINVGFSKFNFNGSSGSRATIQAIAGQTFGMGVAVAQFTATYATVRRCSSLAWTSISGNINISDSEFDTCALLNWTSTSASIDVILDRVTFPSGTHATSNASLSFETAATSGTRRIKQCVFPKSITYGSSKSFEVKQNYFGLGMEATSAATVVSFRENLFRHDGTINSGNGALLPFSSERNYFIVDNNTGNPHFISPTALLGADNTVSQSIFEAHTPDLVDYGDCFLIASGATSGGKKILGKNNIVLPSTGGGTVSSGTLLTMYANATSVVEFQRNTVNVNNPSSGTYPKRAAFAVAEAGNGAADQVAVLKGNVAWGSSASQGFLAERLEGSVQGHFTATGVNYNWRHNTSDGDNGRGFEAWIDGNLWAVGNATAAGADANQGSGDPQFYDSTRNVQAWCTARGYGTTYAEGLTALQADPTRADDLIRYVFEGFRPQNASCRTAAHDGGCVGAANYAKSRATRKLIRLRTQLSDFGI